MYKIIYQNMIIDVVKKLKYCKHLQHANRTLLCDKTSANCIVSSDGSQVYHIKGTLAMPDKYKSVEIVEIDKDEYDYLCSLTIQVNPIPNEQQEVDELDDPVVLKQRVNELQNEVSMLTECIIEMSTILYS